MHGVLLPRCSHITRKRGVYFFRRRLPAGHGGEVAMSLGTRSFRLAEAFGEALDRAFESFFARVQMAAFNVTAELRRYLAEERAKLRALHLATPPGKRVHGTNVPGIDALTADLRDIELHIMSLKASLSQRRFSIKEQEADERIGDREASALERRELALGMLQAQVQVLEQSREWLRSGLIPTIDEEVDMVAAISVASVTQSVVTQPAPSQLGVGVDPLLWTPLKSFSGVSHAPFSKRLSAGVPASVGGVGPIRPHA